MFVEGVVVASSYRILRLHPSSDDDQSRSVFTMKPRTMERAFRDSWVAMRGFDSARGSARSALVVICCMHGGFYIQRLNLTLDRIAESHKTFPTHKVDEFP